MRLQEFDTSLPGTEWGQLQLDSSSPGCTAWVLQCRGGTPRPRRTRHSQQERRPPQSCVQFLQGRQRGRGQNDSTSRGRRPRTRPSQDSRTLGLQRTAGRRPSCWPRVPSLHSRCRRHIEQGQGRQRSTNLPGKVTPRRQQAHNTGLQRRCDRQSSNSRQRMG